MTLWYPHSLATASTTYFDLTTGITLPVARVFSTDSSDSNPAPETGDDQHVEELQLQCTHCPDMFLPDGCFSHVGAFGKTVVQHFCETGENCQRALAAAKTRRGAWLALHKQGQDMIKSSNKRVKLLEVCSNVRIPIPSVDRAPISPTSLVGVVLNVSSTGNTFRLGTQQPQKQPTNNLKNNPHTTSKQPPKQPQNNLKNTSKQPQNNPQTTSKTT